MDHNHANHFMTSAMLKEPLIKGVRDRPIGPRVRKVILHSLGIWTGVDEETLKSVAPLSNRRGTSGFEALIWLWPGGPKLIGVPLGSHVIRIIDKFYTDSCPWGHFLRNGLLLWLGGFIHTILLYFAFLVLFGNDWLHRSGILVLFLFFWAQITLVWMVLISASGLEWFGPFSSTNLCQRQILPDQTWPSHLRISFFSCLRLLLWGWGQTQVEDRVWSMVLSFFFVDLVKRSAVCNCANIPLSVKCIFRALQNRQTRQVLC